MLVVAYVLVTFILLVDDPFKRQNNSICVSMCVCAGINLFHRFELQKSPLSVCFIVCEIERGSLNCAMFQVITNKNIM